VSSVTHFYAMLEGPSHAVAVDTLPDYDRADTWVSLIRQPDWTYRRGPSSPAPSSNGSTRTERTVSERINDHNGQYDAAGADTAWGCRVITNQSSLFDIVRATPPRSAGYLYVRAYLVPELVAEPEGERS
jgi:hypothetical protein